MPWWVLNFSEKTMAGATRYPEKRSVFSSEQPSFPRRFLHLCPGNDRALAESERGGEERRTGSHDQFGARGRKVFSRICEVPCTTSTLPRPRPSRQSSKENEKLAAFWIWQPVQEFGGSYWQNTS